MILILGGTSDSHEYIENLNQDYIVTVATEYGHKEYSERYGAKVLHTRFDENSLLQIINDQSIIKIVDTTHPFAREITKTAQKVCTQTGIEYINAKRKTHIPLKYLNYSKFYGADTFETANSYIMESNKPFFTIGSKKLYYFKNHLKNAVVRVLDDDESIEICRRLGVADANIVAAKGPFTLEDNLAVIDKFGITCLVTKESGDRGGFSEKAEAAVSRNIDLIVIQNNRR